MQGYTGKILRVDLSSSSITEEELTESRARKVLGGRGLGASIVFDEVPAGADPLGPENVLVLALGPLAGTYAPGCGRLAAVAKSPLTGVFGEAYTGGLLPHELKYAGYDALAVRGRAKKPVYLSIVNGFAEIRDASELWGHEVGETEELIRSELGDRRCRIASIGVAGEKAVRFACLMNDTDRAAGRTGLGAVMGSKNLKAIAVRGTGAVRVADPEAFRLHALANIALIREHAWLSEGLPDLGTAGLVESLDSGGILPTGNWESGTFEGAGRISGTAIRDNMLLGRRGCMGCPVGCQRSVRVESGRFAGVRPEYGGPEYETVAALGSLCRNDDLEAIAMANQLCNAHGMDTISAGSTIAFAMDCFEKGILTEKQAGFPIRWGDADTIVKLVDLIARREGIGEILADGTRMAAEALGKGAADLAVQVKGLELGMHEPRGKQGLVLSYATAPRGADHMEGFHDTSYVADDVAPELGIVEGMEALTLEGKAPAVGAAENYNSFINSIPICSFMSLTVAGIHNAEEITGLLRAATGWDDLSFEEEMEIGERNYNICRAATVREGEVKDVPAAKLFRPLNGGATDGEAIGEKEFEKALGEYYRFRGWAPGGIPSRARLKKLGLSEVAEVLHGGGKA